MPKLTAVVQSSEQCVHNTILDSARAAWVSNTVETLESAYKQEIESVTETSDFVVFNFVASEQRDEGKSYVEKIEYIKPESKLASTSYETRFIYIWGYTAGFVTVGQKEGVWNTIKNTLITVAGVSGPQSMTVASFCASMLYIAIDYFESTQYVLTRSEAKYYYLNKITQVKDTVLATGCHIAILAFVKDFADRL